LTAIDLFSGAGGLSLGLEWAGFDVVAAVEINKEIAKTYKANHPKCNLLVKDLREVSGKDLLRGTGLKSVTMIAGCPPCQGFSSLTRKYHKEDPRNGLILEMARIIEEIKPNIVMVENVPGIETRGGEVLQQFIGRLETMGYKVSKHSLQLANYGIPQSRRRFVLLAGMGFEIPIPNETHGSDSQIQEKDLLPRITLKKALSRIHKRAVTLSYAKVHGGPKKFKWHVIRDLSPVSKKRLRALKAGRSRFSLPEELRPNCHLKKNKGFGNVYGRMSWKQVAPTITSGCTTPCMGRFGHPTLTRTISIREAATIQTFPKSYKFDTEYMDTACDLVGNALPPKFAKKISSYCLKQMLKWNSDNNVL
jgi:DNA (cytosine-5)-methyltransferase 1